MEEGRRNIIDLLRRWLSGEGRARDEARLHQAASDDDFLRDALEGFQSIPEGRHEQAIARIQQRLKTRTQGKRRPIRLWPAIAAAAVTLIAAGAALWLITSPENTVEREAMVLHDEQEPVTDVNITASDNPEATSLREEEKVTETAPGSENRKLADAAPATSENASAPAVKKPAAKSPPPPEADPKRAASAKIDEMQLAAAEKAGESLSSAARSRSLAPVDTLSSLASSTRVISGRVTDEEGAPVGGVSVILPGTASETVTNSEGAFSIAAPQEQKKLLVNPANLSPSLIPINDQNAVNITLNEQQVEPLREVTRALQSAPKGLSIDVVPAPSNASAVPEGGFDAFEDFLQENMRYPKKARRNRVSGIVLLEFTVHPDGTLSDFIVLRSPDMELEKEAIRLLSTGPKWRLQNASEPAAIRYPVVFEEK